MTEQEEEAMELQERIEVIEGELGLPVNSLGISDRPGLFIKSQVSTLFPISVLRELIYISERLCMLWQCTCLECVRKREREYE